MKFLDIVERILEIYVKGEKEKSYLNGDNSRVIIINLIY